MKQATTLLLLLLISAPCAEAADVKLKQLKDFDAAVHSMGVNVEVEIKGGCKLNPVKLEQTFTGLLEVFGFQVTALEESQLEFAVSVKGFPASAEQPCGIRTLSMVRQIPEIRMLRLSSGSSSTRYRLWTSENVITASNEEILSLLQEQAREDVVSFSRSFAQHH